MIGAYDARNRRGKVEVPGVQSLFQLGQQRLEQFRRSGNSLRDPRQLSARNRPPYPA
jgi:hypothetical protein